MLRHIFRLIFLILPLGACAQSAPSTTAASGPAQAGVHYVLAPKPGTWLPENGKIEVVEYFSYTCSHCAEFQPMIDRWKKTMPKDVVFHYIPNAYDLEFPYSRAFFAAENLKALPKVHQDLFVAIHEDGRLPRNATVDEIATYFAQRGIDRAKAIAAIGSPDVSAKMKRANRFVIDKNPPGTPTLVVAGKYVIQGDTYQEYIDNLNAVLTMERAKRSASARPAAPKPAATSP